MKFLFVDESMYNVREKEKIFLLAGLMVDEKKIYPIEEKLREIKRAYDIEYTKRVYKKTKEIKSKFTNEVVNLFKDNNVNVISSVLGNMTLKQKQREKEKKYLEGLNFIIERFLLHLNKEKEYGIVIHDIIDKKIQNKVRENFYNDVIHKPLEMYGHKKADYKELIYPSIFFTDDKCSELLQIADLISHSLLSAIRKNIDENKKISVEQLYQKNYYLGLYWPLFVRNSEGKVSG